ncbi:MAG TPA: hypothetical protein VF233_11535 [Nitrososphaeraceae archaeon]
MAYIPIMIPLVLIYILVDLLKELDSLSGTQGFAWIYTRQNGCQTLYVQQTIFGQTDPNAE